MRQPSDAPALASPADLNPNPFDTQQANKLRLSALRHRVQRIGIPHCAIACSRPLLSVTYKLYGLAVVLLFPVVSLEAPKLFMARRN